jgi:hypothetical protein
MTGGPPGGYGPRPGSGEDPEKTPTYLHAMPLRVPTKPGMPPPPPPYRAQSPAGGTLARLGQRGASAPDLIVTDPDDGSAATPARVAVMTRLLRTCDALPIEDLRLLQAIALRLRPGVGG